MLNMLKKNTAYVLILLLVLLSGCGDTPIKINTPKQPVEANETFDAISNEVFLYLVQSNSITLNFSLSKPEDYGISRMEPTFGDFGDEATEKELAYDKELLARLKKIDPKLLTDDRKLTYDILYRDLKNDIDSAKFNYYNEVLSPTQGIQAELPILLTEYHFYNVEDIEDYITLLTCLPDYFDQIIDFEREKSEQGLFMTSSAAEDVIDQCAEFIKNPEENLIITVIGERIDDYDGLSPEEKADFKLRNKEAVLNSVIPAYENLITALTDLNSENTFDSGLVSYPHGKAFYKFLLENNSGSSKSVGEVDKLLSETINKNLDELFRLVNENPDSYEASLKPVYPAEEPEDILNYLKANITANYPPMDDVEYTIKYVDPSLEDHLSPAFYLPPPIDDYQNNSIYINRKSQKNDSSDLFTTLAHEGYPGHLYQIVYFKQQKPEMLRNMMDFGGYTEGWATYVELDSYYNIDDPTVSELLYNNMSLTLCLYAKVDIGVNYYGWDRTKTVNYLAEYGVTNRDSVDKMYDSMVAEPTNYTKYTLGYLEFLALRDRAKTELGADFDLKEFHEFILNTGPAWFDIIDEQMTLWIQQQKGTVENADNADNAENAG